MTKFLRLFAALLVISITAKAQVNVITESFEGTFPPSGWTIFNNGTGNDWTQNTTATYSSVGNNSMQYAYSSTDPADAWAFAPSFTAVAGDHLSLTFDYRIRSATWPENLKVTIGNAADVTSQTIILLNAPNLSNITYQSQTITYTIPANGNYTIAFNCYSAADQFYLYIDNINATVTPGVACIDPPTAGTLISSAMTVCPNEIVSFSTIGGTADIGQTFQWQSSSDSLVWVDIMSANSESYSAIMTDTTYYRIITFCGAGSDTTNEVKVQVKPFNLCYCNDLLHSGACPAGDVSNVNIVGTSFNNNTTCTGANSYSAYSEAVATADLVQGLTYTFNITTGADNVISLFIDYDQNGSFDASEFTEVCLTSTIGGTTTVSFTVPQGALIGKTGMRIRTRSTGNPNGSGDACTEFFSGETQDYIVNIVSPGPCVDPPSAGVATVSLTTACNGTAVNINLLGASYGTGQTYVWQFSTDSLNWFDTTAANVGYYNVVVTSTLYYRAIVNCGAGYDTSNAVKISLTPSALCGCASGATNTADDDIGNVTFNTINNGNATPALNNSTSINTYSDYTSITTFAVKGIAYPVSVTQINETTWYDCILGVYVDLNQDGDLLDAGELVFSGATNSALGGNIMTGNITIPTTATPGMSLMRFVLTEATTVDPCGTYGYGETEDYMVQIVEPGPCVDPPTAGITIANNTFVCPFGNINMSLQGADYGTGLTYQWQSTTDTATSWTNISSANTPSYSVAGASLAGISAIYYRCELVCGSASHSIPVKLVIHPFNECYCIDNIHTNVCDSSVIMSNINITGTGFNNSHTCVEFGDPYVLFPDTGSATVTLRRASTYTVNVKSLGDEAISMWIDYNQNGAFEASEYTSITTTMPATGTAYGKNFTVPNTAVIGLTGMRVRSRNTGAPNGSGDACTMFTSGTTQDYAITIDFSTSQNSNMVDKTMEVYPNPSTGLVNFSFNTGKTSMLNIVVTDVKGAVVYSESNNQTIGTITRTIDLNDAAKGVYLIKVISDAGVTTKKLVIK